MIKKYIYLLTVLAAGFFFSSCDNSTEPTPATTGGVYIQSTPAGAQIWVDNSNSNKVTPDSVTGLATGSHNITLKLSGYNDTTFAVTVSANVNTSKQVTLTSSVLTVTYGPVRMWETTGTSPSQPSGLILSTGTAVSIASGTLADIYYSSTGFVVKSAAGLNNRDTRFLMGNSNTLTDSVAAPTFTGSWASEVKDTVTNYFFLHDQDNHYSKMIISSRGGGTPGNPAWVEVTFIYNKTAGDQRFK